MSKINLIYQGKAKELYQTESDGVLRVVYLDQATALNGLRKDEILGKGQLNNQITSLVFNYLTTKQVKHHFIEEVSKTEQLVNAVKMLPLEVVIRNIATGSFVKKFNGLEGTIFAEPILEYYYKNDTLADPMINEAQIKALGLATEAQLAEIKQSVLQLNSILQALFKQIDLTLVDFKVEYGLDGHGEIVLADEITPDTCRLWDLATGASLDKDVYRQERGDLVSVYQEVYQRLQTMLNQQA